MHWGRKRPGDPGHAPRIGAGNGALGQATARGSGARPAHWGRKRCTGAGNGPGIRGTPRALGQATVHWGRQIAYSNACFPAPMRVLLLRCVFSCLNAAHRTRGRTAAVVPSHGVRPRTRRRRPDHRRGSSAAPTDCVQHTPRRRPVFTAIPRSAWATPRAVPHSGSVFRAIPHFHRDTTLCKCYNACKVWYPCENSASLANQSPHQPNGPEKRWDSEGKSLQNTPSRPDFPLRTRHRLQNSPSPGPRPFCFA